MLAVEFFNNFARDWLNGAPVSQSCLKEIVTSAVDCTFALSVFLSGILEISFYDVKCKSKGVVLRECFPPPQQENIHSVYRHIRATTLNNTV